MAKIVAALYLLSVIAFGVFKAIEASGVMPVLTMIGLFVATIGIFAALVVVLGPDA